MSAIFSKNCILSNDTDYYCLVCEEAFATEDTILVHILFSKHKKNFNSYRYLDKYEGHFIRKINGLYFCEPCVATFPTATKVNLHVQDTSHLQSVDLGPRIKRVNHEIIAGQFIISEDAWNGLIDDTCVICTTEFDDAVEHKAIRSHFLNLIKNNAKIHISHEGVYREIDACSDQCLICNTIIGKDSSINHFQGDSHKDLVKFYKPASIENNNDFALDNNKSKLSESADTYQNNNINIDFINDTAVCKKCSKNIDFNIDAIEKHIEEHKETSNTKSRENVKPLPSGNKTNGTDGTTLYTTPVSLAAGKKLSSGPTASSKKSSSGSTAPAKKFGFDPSAIGKMFGSQTGESANKPSSHRITPLKKLQEFASQHGLTHNYADNSFYCKICTRRVPATLEDLEKHVAANSHKDNKKQASIKEVAVKAPVKEPLLETITCYEIVDTDGEVINIINNKHWINAFGFYLIAKFNHTIICHACNIDLIEENVLNHMLTDTHKDFVTNCLWITSLEDEFIREIKLDVYHCGYCNHLEHDWDDILEHIELAEHKKNKLEARQNLRKHKSNPCQRVTDTDIKRMLMLFRLHARNSMLN